jgi:hypothetical protein
MSSNAIFHLTRFVLAMALSASAQVAPVKTSGTNPPTQHLLTRHYYDGEKISYHMKASNRQIVAGNRQIKIIFQRKPDGIVQ